MGKSEEVVLEIDGGGDGTVTLKIYTVQKWSDVAADLERSFPELKREGGASRGFKYRGAFNREKVVNDDASLEKFFSHAVEEAQLTQSVVLVSSIRPDATQQAQTVARRASESSAPNAIPAGKAAAVYASVIQFPRTPAGDTMLQVRPVVLWGKEQLTVSVFLNWSAESDTSNDFIFSYSKARPGTSAQVDLGLSSPRSLCLHLKGDVVETGASLKASTWYHVAVTWSSRDGSLVLYIDGNKAFSASKMRIGTTLEQGGAFILGNFQSGSHAFVGCMAEVSVWKGVVERELIRKMSQKPLLKGSEDRLCLYLNFKGTSADDSSMVVDASSDIEARLRGGAAVLKKTMTIRGGGTAADAEGATAGRPSRGGGAATFLSSVVRFEERSFGRLLARPRDVATNELTIALWLCTLDSMQHGTVFSWLWMDVSGILHRVELANCANLHITIGPPSALVATKVAVNDGLWHFLVVTWQSSTGELVLYVDGMEKFASGAISRGLVLDAGGATPAGSGIMAVGQRLADLSKRGISDLAQAYFGLVAHLSLWRAALSASAARKLMAGPLDGAEKDVVVYLNPDSTEFGSRLLTDAAHAKRGLKLEWHVLGPVDLVKSAVVGAAEPAAAAAPLLDRQIVNASLVLEAKTAGRLAIQPLQLLDKAEDDSGEHASGQMSICVWLMASPWSQTALEGECLFCYSTGPRDDGDAVALVVSDRSNITVSVNGQQVKTGCRLVQDVWHHLAVTWRGSDGACSLYLDCVQKWQGKIGKEAPLFSANKRSSLWVGKEHCWDAVKQAADAGVPLALLLSILYCDNRAQAARLLAEEDAAAHVAALKHVAGTCLPAYKGGDAAVAGAIYEWLCRACCRLPTGFVGQVSLVCVWRRVLTQTDVAFVSNGALLGNEQALLAFLDVSHFSEEDKTIPDRFREDIHGAVVGGCRLRPHVELRKGVEWLPPHAPGTTPKLAGDMCALQLDKAQAGQASCLVLADLALGTKQGGGNRQPVAGEAGDSLTLSMLIRTSGHEDASATLVSWTAGASSTEQERGMCVWNPGALEVEIAGNHAATGVSVDDGFWHHIIVVWTSAAIKDERGQEQQGGELLVYLDARLAHQGAGKGGGGAQVSREAGTLTVGARKDGDGYGACLQGCIASLALFNRRLDSKAVSRLFAKPVLAGKEKGLRLYFDFDFEADGNDGSAAEISSGVEVLNRAFAGHAGPPAAALLQGGARLILLSKDRQIKLGKVAQDTGAHEACAEGAVGRERGAFEAKCLEFKDSKGGASAYLFPADVMPDRQLTLACWVRSSDAGSLGGHDGDETRVTHKGPDGKDATQLVHVDGGMLFEQVIAKLNERFGELVTWRHSLAPEQQDATTVSTEADFDAFCAAVQKMQEEEEPAGRKPSTGGGASRHPGAGAAPRRGASDRLQAIPVVTAPFKNAAKLLAAASDPEKEKGARRSQLEELCIKRPADLEIVLKGQSCKGKVPININDGRWHHLALTWSSKTGLLVLYVDGNVRLEQAEVQQARRIAPDGCLALGQSQAVLGSTWVTGQGFQGQVAQLGLWNKVLPRSRVQRCMCAPLCGDLDGLGLLWNFDLDPLAAGAQIVNGALESSWSDVKGKVRDRSGLAWQAARLPGDGRVCGLGPSASRSDRLTLRAELCGISEGLSSDSRVQGVFLHLVIGQLGDDTEHALRHGGFPVHKGACQGMRHEQVFHLDALGHAAQRRVLQAVLSEQGGPAELIMQVRLCVEAVAKSGEVSAQVLAKGQIDLLEYLEAGRDEVDKEVRLWPAAQSAGTRGAQDEASATVKISFEVLAALRALKASASKRQPAASATATSSATSTSTPLQELPAFERRKSHFSQAGSTRNLLEGLDVSNAHAQGSPEASGHMAAPTAQAASSPVAAVAPSASAQTASRQETASKPTAVLEPAARRSSTTSAAPHKQASQKEDGDEMDLPDRIVLHCTFSSGQTSRIIIDFQLQWKQVQDILEAELGPARRIQFSEARSKQPCVVNHSNSWEKLRMQVEDDFPRQDSKAHGPHASKHSGEPGDAHIEVKVISADGPGKGEEGGVQGRSGGGHAPTAVQRSKGSNAQDNPDNYDFIFECSELGAGPWATGEPVKITTEPDISWHDFRDLVSQKFGAAVSISYLGTDGKMAPLRTDDDFNAACDQIEDEWDDADGDGSIQCKVQPPASGMPFVKGHSEALLRLPAGDGRRALEAKVARLAPGIQQDMQHLCRELRSKEKKAPAWFPALPATAAPGADELPARLSGITSEQVLKSVYAKILKGQEGEEALLSALEKLVLDDDMQLALAYLPHLEKASKREQDARRHGGARGSGAARDAEVDERVVDWMCFLSRFRLASAHEAAVVAELQDAHLRSATCWVFLRRHELRRACIEPSQSQFSWEKCSPLLKEACGLTDEECKRLLSWAHGRAANPTAAGRPAVPDVMSLAEDAELVDVSGLLPHALDELAVLSVLKKRHEVEAALGGGLQVSEQSKRQAGADGNTQTCGVKLSDAVPLLAGAAGVSLATARRLLMRTASVVLHPPDAAQTEADADQGPTAVEQVVLRGWVDKLWIMHAGELEALERVRDASRQTIRRALVSSLASDKTLLKAIRQCDSEESDGGKDSSESAAGAKDSAPGGRQAGTRLIGIKNAIVAACQRQGVVCSLQEAQALCDEVPLVGGRRDVAGFLEGLQLVDVVDGSLDAYCDDLCPRITSFLEACDDLKSVEPSQTLLLPAQIVQALLSVGVPVNAADAVARQSGCDAAEAVDYRDLVCGRLLVLSERERQRLATPMAVQQRKTMDARRLLVEQRARVMASMAQHDPLGRSFIDASTAVSVLHQVLGLPEQDCQNLIDAASPPTPTHASSGAAQARASASSAAASSTRRIDYSLLGGFQIVLARPGVAAFCGAHCSGCAAVAECFLQRQTAITQALDKGSRLWRSSRAGRAVEPFWGGVGLLPYAQFETALRAEICDKAAGSGGVGRWHGRHVRTLALSQSVLAVDLSRLHQIPTTSEAGGQAGKEKDGARLQAGQAGKAAPAWQGSAPAHHLVRVEQFKQRFTVLEASDAKALRRLVCMPHQRALACASGALSRHRGSRARQEMAGDGPLQLQWSALQDASSPSALLLALAGPLSPSLHHGMASSDAEGTKEEREDLACGDLQGLQDIWAAGSGVESLLDGLVPVYCHMLPAAPTFMLRPPPSAARASQAAARQGRAADTSAAAGHGDGAHAGGAAKGGPKGEQGLTRGQQVFRKLLASRRPGVMQILQAMGAMTPTCVPSPLLDASRRSDVETSGIALANLDAASIRSLQLRFVEARGVPDAGDRYLVKSRLLKMSLFDAYMMKFVGITMSVELTLPKDDKAQSRQAWAPAKSAPSVFVSADLKNHSQMYLYLELHQRSQRKSANAGSEVMQVSCGHALMALKDVPDGTTGVKELSVEGGTPFIPRPITQDLVDGGKKSGLLARLRQGTSAHKSVLSIKLEKVDKRTLEMVKSKDLPPNTLCISDAALPIAQFHSLSTQTRARSTSPQKASGGKTGGASTAGGGAGGSAGPPPPSLEQLFTRAQVDQDPVLALFPKLRESPHMMAHLSAAWAFRYNRLSSKDKASNAVLQRLLRECTLIVWPLMKMRALKEGSPKDAAENQAAACDKYIKAANGAKSLGDMHSVITGASSAVAHQPFRIDELLE